MVLDLGLPDLAGVEVLRQLRTFSRLPVVVLSARDGSGDKVGALDLGADDYVTKPFGAEELLARIRAAGRRAGPDLPVVEAGSLTIDVARSPGDPRRCRRTADARRSGASSRRWSAIPGRLVSQRDLLHEVWGPSYGRETNYLRVYVAGLRKKLEDDPASPRHLLTEAGMGYRFVV